MLRRRVMWYLCVISISTSLPEYENCMKIAVSLCTQPLRQNGTRSEESRVSSPTTFPLRLFPGSGARCFCDACPQCGCVSVLFQIGAHVSAHYYGSLIGEDFQLAWLCPEREYAVELEVFASISRAFSGIATTIMGRNFTSKLMR
jgi:hypothetical protein